MWLQLKQLLHKLENQISKQIKHYKSSKIIQKKKTVSKTILATGLYICSMLVVLPSLIHVLLDIAFYGTATIISMTLFYWSQTIS